MVFEFIDQKKDQDTVVYRGLVSLPDASQLSTSIFSVDWGVPIIRPKSKNVEKLLFYSGDAKISNSQKQDTEYLLYIEKIREILKLKRKEFSELVFIDVRFGKNLKNDVVVNAKPSVSKKFIEPIVNNMSFSGWNFSFNNQNGDMGLIDCVCADQEGLRSFQIVLDERLFDKNSGAVDGRKVFEETIVFSQLSISKAI